MLKQEVLFECDYRYQVPWKSLIFTAPIPGLFLLFGWWAHSVLIVSLTALWCAGVAGVIAHNHAEHDHAKIQVCQRDVRVVRENGTVVRAFDFREMQSIKERGKDSVVVEMPIKGGSALYTLTGVTDAVRFAETAAAQLRQIQSGVDPVQQTDLLKIPEQAFWPEQSACAESDTDTLHAAEQLRMTGQITQEQYDVMTGKKAPQQAPVPAAAASADMQNAEDFLRRNEMIAQQMRAEQAADENQQEGQNDGTGCVI
ncbi:MAG: hypothetical protein J5753_05980 [Oscillospiraceae bacterium]|nr:hypothetical protein [Oscillospiraceae bacterium]